MDFKFTRDFWLKGLALAVMVTSVVVVFSFSVAESKLKQDLSYLEKRTTLQLNIEKERVVSWLSKVEHYGSEFVNAEPLRTFVVALANSESIEKNKTFLEEEKVYIQTVLDGFIYQNSLKRGSLIAGTGEVFLYSGYDGNLTKDQKQLALAVIAESKLRYLPVKKENGELILEIFKPIYGFVVDDLPVAVLHMAVKLDSEFIDLITKDLPVEENETIALWQHYNNAVQEVKFVQDTGSLDLVEGFAHSIGFFNDKTAETFYNTVKIQSAPLYLTLETNYESALKTYNLYVHNLRIIAILAIVSVMVFAWGIFSKIVVKKYKQELDYKERLAKQSEKTVFALVKTLELRDPYLAGHYSNVKDNALLLADEMQLSEDDKSTLRYAALLAGIGKIAIPKDILTKPTKLTAEETKIMQSHVSFAEEILEDMEFDLPIKDVVSQMYERLDGSGYPRALSGTEINKLARILAVCDVFCALRAPRSYREGKSAKQALEIMQGDIALFDAEVLAKLFKIINK